MEFCCNPVLYHNPAPTVCEPHVPLCTSLLLLCKLISAWARSLVTSIFSSVRPRRDLPLDRVRPRSARSIVHKILFANYLPILCCSFFKAFSEDALILNKNIENNITSFHAIQKHILKQIANATQFRVTTSSHLSHVKCEDLAPFTIKGR